MLAQDLLLVNATLTRDFNPQNELLEFIANNFAFGV